MADMSRAALAADHRAALMDAADLFSGVGDIDFIRHLDQAALDLSRFRPRIVLGSVSLVAVQALYDPPTGMIDVRLVLWGRRERQTRSPWADDYPVPPPTARLLETQTGLKIRIDPAPSAAQIADLGAEFDFMYAAIHGIGTDAADTTVRASDRGLLLLRAAAEAMGELARAGVRRPVQWNNGLGSQPTQGTPAALAKDLMAQFVAEART